MKKLLYIITAVAVFSLAVVSPAHALILQSGDFVTVDDPVKDDIYIIAGNADVNADVSGDLYIMGGEVQIDSNVAEDLVVMGGRVSLLGEVKGDVRILGGDVFIYGDVADDLLVAGGKVDVGKDATIGGSVLAGAGYLSMEGVVREDVHGGFGVFFLKGRVDGNVVVTVQENFDVSDDAIVGGNLEYSALIDADVPEKVVKGEVAFNQFDQEDTILGDITEAGLMLRFFSFAGGLLLALILVILAPKALMNAGMSAREHIFKAFGLGILTVIVAFVAPVILMMTVIGIPLALLILAVLLVLFYVGQVFAAAWLSNYFLVRMTKKSKKKKSHEEVSKAKLFGLMTAGLLLYHLVTLIPYVGWLLKIVMFMVGVGSLWILKKDYWKILKKEKMI